MADEEDLDARSVPHGSRYIIPRLSSPDGGVSPQLGRVVPFDAKQTYRLSGQIVNLVAHRYYTPNHPQFPKEEVQS